MPSFVSVAFPHALVLSIRRGVECPNPESTIADEAPHEGEIVALELLGKPVIAALKEDLVGRTEALKAAGVVPTLAIVRVGEREDDLSYERTALKRAEGLGIEVRRFVLAEDAGQDALMAAAQPAAGRFVPEAVQIGFGRRDDSRRRKAPFPVAAVL